MRCTSLSSLRERFDSMREVAVLTSGFLPVPNVLGGAVEALEMTLITENEKKRKVAFRVFSIWDDKAVEEAEKFKNTKFHFIKVPSLIKALDKSIYWFTRNILSIDHTTTYRYLCQRVWFILCVAWALKRDPVDSVLVEDHPILFNCMRLFGNRDRYRGRIYYHLHRDFKKDFGLGRVISEVERVIGVSQYTIESLTSFLRAKYGIEMQDEQLCVVKNCVDSARFNPYDSSIKASAKKMRDSLGIPAESCVISFSGRLTPEKGVKELLQAFLEIKDLGAHLVIAGSHFYGTGTYSPFEEKLKKLMDQAPDQVSFTGYLDYRLMPSFYMMSDIMCVPSLCQDAAPMAVVEALALGKPVVATRSGGIPEYAKEGASILVNRGECLVSDLARGLGMLILSDEKRNRMSREALLCSKGLNESVYYSNFMMGLDVECPLGGE